jgi:hypothetical protein
MASPGSSNEFATTKSKLLLPVGPHDSAHVRKPSKVTIVGAAGAVGLACAYSIINQGLASELALVDVSDFAKLTIHCTHVLKNTPAPQ